MSNLATTAVVNTNNLELNKGDDFIIALDISGSMQATDCPGGFSRIKYSLEQFQAFAKEAAKYDTDGVSLYAFGMNVHSYPDVSEDKLDGVIKELTGKQLEGGTMTHLAIQKAWEEHKSRKNEQTVLMVFTDGEPMDENAVFKTIADITNNVKDEREFNIAFVTVGNRTPGLQAFLTKLDDAIPGAKYDIVDVKKLEEVDFYKSFEGALND
jgi:uncharacterized protein with von Willebrand factor type A (vWA) domain